MVDSWDSFASQITVEGHIEGYTAEDCSRVEQRLGIALPPSYREFVRRFGLGDWPDQNFWVSVPCEPEFVESLDYSFKSHGSILGYWLDNKKAKDPERARRLLGFADTSFGVAFAWDPATGRPDGEMDIYAFEMPDLVAYCCHDLLSFLRDFWVGGRINKVLNYSKPITTEPFFKVCKPSLPLGKPLKS